jgi:hypothetical protein
VEEHKIALITGGNRRHVEQETPTMVNERINYGNFTHNRQFLN